jgi:putative copper export protein
MFKVVILLFVLMIVFSLGSGLYYLVRDKSHSDRVVKALSWRIGLSLLLFILLFVAFAMGWITPHGI